MTRRLLFFISLQLVDHCPLVQHNSTTNSTLDDNPITFPLDGRALYVDATHEVTIVNSESSTLFAILELERLSTR